MDSIHPLLDQGQTAQLFLLTLREEEQHLILLWIRHFNPILDRHRCHLILLRPLLVVLSTVVLHREHRLLRTRLFPLTLREEEQRQIQGQTQRICRPHQMIQWRANNL